MPANSGVRLSYIALSRAFVMDRLFELLITRVGYSTSTRKASFLRTRGSLEERRRRIQERT